MVGIKLTGALVAGALVLTMYAAQEDVSYSKELQARRLAERTAWFEEYASPYRTLFLQQLGQFFPEDDKVYTTAQRLSSECLDQKKLDACNQLNDILEEVFKEAQARCVRQDLDQAFELAREIGANMQLSDMVQEESELSRLQEGEKSLQDRLQRLHDDSPCRMCFDLQDFKQTAIYMYARYPIVTSERDESIKHLLVENKQVIFSNRRQPLINEKNPNRYAVGEKGYPSTRRVPTAPFSLLILMAGRMRSAVTRFHADETMGRSPFEGVEVLEPGEKDLSIDHPAYQVSYRTRHYVDVGSAYWKDPSSYRWM